MRREERSMKSNMSVFTDAWLACQPLCDHDGSGRKTAGTTRKVDSKGVAGSNQRYYGIKYSLEKQTREIPRLGFGCLVVGRTWS